MFPPRSFTFAVLAFLAFQSTVQAGPITYDFSGTLTQPANGSSQFSGSFTVNANPPVIDYEGF